MQNEQATLGGGCFWCLEAIFERQSGVKSVTSGYAGGAEPNPSYEAVCTGNTGHAEVIQVEYDPETISYAELLDLFWGGRPMTGYLAWVFPFVALFFHLPVVFNGQWSWRIEARIIACIMVFWLVEDFLWFVLNPAYGIAKFTPANVPWHIHWTAFAPTDYWTMSAAAVVLFFLSRARTVVR